MSKALPCKPKRDVALLAEGVDRNYLPSCHHWSHCVALLAEGVDRNLADCYLICTIMSVALLAEGVDRNSEIAFSRAAAPVSPSSRRAWIEIR